MVDGERLLGSSRFEGRLPSLTHQQQANFSLDDWLVWRACQTDHTKAFTEADHEIPVELKTSLCLLYLRRIGQANDIIFGKIHVNYDAIPTALMTAVNRQREYFEIDWEGRTKLRDLVRTGKFKIPTPVKKSHPYSSSLQDERAVIDVDDSIPVDDELIISKQSLTSASMNDEMFRIKEEPLDDFNGSSPIHLS